ncbi:MAG: hypothetical protein ACM3ZA_10705 [Bacillota bacterium]
MYKSDGGTTTQEVRWNLSDMKLVSIDRQTQFSVDGHHQEVAVSSSGGNRRIKVTSDFGGRQVYDLPDDSLVLDEWAWRLSALPFRNGMTMRATMVWPNRWSEKANASVVVTEPQILQARRGGRARYRRVPSTPGG